jgi:hypothetical protein
VTCTVLVILPNARPTSHQIYLDVTNNRGSWKFLVRDAIFIHLIYTSSSSSSLPTFVVRFLSCSYIHSRPQPPHQMNACRSHVPYIQNDLPIRSNPIACQPSQTPERLQMPMLSLHVYAGYRKHYLISTISHFLAIVCFVSIIKLSRGFSGPIPDFLPAADFVGRVAGFWLVRLLA